MDIKSFGCSFIFGSDLADQINLTPSNQTWPALVAKQLNVGYQCYARPGIGNLQIAEQVLNQLNDPALYIISWTWIDRFDYTDSNNDQWRTIMPVDTDSIAKTYYRDMHSEYRDKLTTLMNMRLVIDVLKQRNKKFMMTCIDDLTFDTRWHITPAIAELQNYVRPHMTQFDNKSFLEWSRDKGYPESAQWHPLEQAHLEASQHLLAQQLFR